jgi:hypothetical protein
MTIPEGKKIKIKNIFIVPYERVIVGPGYEW